jgi:hypothetical protein
MRPWAIYKSEVEELFEKEDSNSIPIARLLKIDGIASEMSTPNKQLIQ